MARQKQKRWQVYFDLNAPRENRLRKRRPGRELPIHQTFSWGGTEWRIPAVYVCAQGLVADFVRRVPAGSIQTFTGRWKLRPDEDRYDFTREERMQLDSENPLTKDFLYPDHCIALGYTVEPPLPRNAFHLADCSEGNRPRRVHKPALCEPEQALSATVCVLGTEPDLPKETQVGVIGSADGPTAIFVASPQEKARTQMRCDVSSLYFELPETLEWLMVFQKLPCGPVKRKLL